MIYAFLRRLFSLATAGFYRRVEVEGLERIPAQGPVLILANHPNGLVDPFLILARLEREVSLTAKSTLAKNPFLGLLIRLGRVVLVHRRQDQGAGADMSRNAEALAEARKRLAQGGAILMFPEGISHDLPEVQPLKSGAARIALEYLEIEGNPGGLMVVPVGIDYLAKDGFRSEALVRVAEPIDMAAWKAAHPQGDAKALTADVDAALREHTLNFLARQESELLRHAAELVLTQGDEPVRVSEASAGARALVGEIESLQKAYYLHKEERAAEIAGLAVRLHAYRERLNRLGLHPREVFIDLSWRKALLFSLRESAAFFLGLPLAALGFLAHAPAYFACLGLTRWLGKEVDVRATYAVFSAVLFFPLLWILGGLAAFAWLEPAESLALFLLQPLSLWAALKFRDHFLAVSRRALTFLLFLARPALREDLVLEGRGLLTAIGRFQQEAA